MDTSPSLNDEAEGAATQRGGAATSAHAWRIVSHGLMIVAGWVLFFWGWQRVLDRGADFSELRWLVFGAMVVVPVVTVSWILHNRGIHRRKGPRRRVPAAALDYRVDFHGREVVAEFRALASAQRIDIELDGALKRYRPGAGADWRAGAGASDLRLQARKAIEQAGSAHAVALESGRAAGESTAADDIAPRGGGRAA